MKVGAEHGFSVVESVIAIGIITTIVVFSALQLQTQTLNTKNFEQNRAADSLIDLLNVSLSAPTACALTMGSGSSNQQSLSGLPLDFDIINASGVPVFEIGASSPYEGNKVYIENYTLLPIDLKLENGIASGIAHMDFFIRKTDQSIGSSLLVRSLKMEVQLQGDIGTFIDTCRSLGVLTNFNYWNLEFDGTTIGNRNSSRVVFGSQLTATAPLTINANTESAVSNNYAHMHAIGANNTSASVAFQSFGDTFYHAPYITAQRVEGTAATPQAITNGTNLSALQVSGWHQGSWAQVSSLINMSIDNWANNLTPTTFVVSGSPRGDAGSRYNQLYISRSGTAISNDNGYRQPREGLEIYGDAFFVPRAGLDPNQFNPYIAIGRYIGAVKATNKYLFNHNGNFVIASDNYSLNPDISTVTPHLTALSANRFVGIGISNPIYPLDINGDIRISGTPFRASGDIAWQVPSDLRLKDRISNFNYGLVELEALNTYRFYYKRDNLKKIDSHLQQIGVKAQEIQKIVPSAVSKDKDGFLNINITPLFWMLVNSIKDISFKALSIVNSIKDLESSVFNEEQKVSSLKVRFVAAQEKQADLIKKIIENEIELTELQNKFCSTVSNRKHCE